jgi:hypothetical protein
MAVFPTLLPVPITASEGFADTSWYPGGESSKSLPLYRAPAARTREAMRIRSRYPITGSSERSTTRSTSCSRRALSTAETGSAPLTSGTP